MAAQSKQKPIINNDYTKSLYQRYTQAAVVRSIASFVMWLFALIAYFLDIIHFDNLTGAGIAVLYLILKKLMIQLLPNISLTSSVYWKLSGLPQSSILSVVLKQLSFCSFTRRLSLM
jgi:hypothetical protein